MEISMDDIYTGEKSKTAPFSYLDKGIDDMEAGRLHTADDAFHIIKTRLADEV